jgi:hypothetical protein
MGALAAYAMAACTTMANRLNCMKVGRLLLQITSPKPSNPFSEPPGLMSVAICIGTAMPPSPVIFPLVLTPFIKIAVLPVVFAFPLEVIISFMVIPAMVIVVVRVIDTIAGGGAAPAKVRWRNQGCGK